MGTLHNHESRAPLYRRVVLLRHRGGISHTWHRKQVVRCSCMMQLCCALSLPHPAQSTHSATRNQPHSPTDSYETVCRLSSSAQVLYTLYLMLLPLQPTPWRLPGTNSKQHRTCFNKGMLLKRNQQLHDGGDGGEELSIINKVNRRKLRWPASAHKLQSEINQVFLEMDLTKGTAAHATAALAASSTCRNQWPCPLCEFI